MGYIIATVIIGTMWWFIYRSIHPKRAKGPMYVRQLKPDGTFRERPQIKPDELSAQSATCSICRLAFRTGSDIFKVICPDCWDRIDERDKNFRPDYITDDRDWEYLNNHKYANFWIINSDYEHGDISADEASRLMHRLVPEDFGKIRPFPYREFQEFIRIQHTHLNGGPDRYCTVCGYTDSRCTCREGYEKDMQLGGGKAFAELKPYLDRLRELNPKFVLDKYYKKNGVIHAQLLKRTGFDIRDYISLSDWQVIRYIVNRAKYKGYTEASIRSARQEYIKLIETDLKILIKYHEARARGERPDFPILPSTNLDSIYESAGIAKPETLHDKLLNEFY